MKRGEFIRVTVFLLPDPISTPDLSILTTFCIMSGVVRT